MFAIQQKEPIGAGWITVRTHDGYDSQDQAIFIARRKRMARASIGLCQAFRVVDLTAGVVIWPESIAGKGV